MNKELFPGTPQASPSGAALQMGVALPGGTDFDPKKITFLKEVRTLFPQFKITIFTHSKYWGEFDLFGYYDDVAAVSDENDNSLKDVIKEWNLDVLIEIGLDRTAQCPDREIVPECWASHFRHRRDLKISDEITGNIYVKDHTISADLDDVFAALGTVDVGDAELHESITREIRVQGPLDQIVLAPWLSGGRRNAAWKAEIWEDIGKRLVESGLRVVLAGSAEHHPAAAALRDAIGAPGVDLSVGRASLRQTAILLGRARGALSAPGTIARLAALAGTPLVIIDSAALPHHTEPAVQAAAAVANLQRLFAAGPVGACPD
jgi:hypothetical protein